MDIAYRKTHKNQIRERSRRSVTFKGRTIPVESCPRIGQCSNCNRRIGIDGIKKTHLHHDKYDYKHSLKYTRELCVRCHRGQHAKKKTNKRRVILHYRFHQLCCSCIEEKELSNKQKYTLQ